MGSCVRLNLSIVWDSFPVIDASLARHMHQIESVGYEQFAPILTS